MSRQLRNLNGIRRERHLRTTAPNQFPIPPRSAITERPLTDQESQEAVTHAFQEAARRLRSDVTVPGLTDHDTWNTCTICRRTWKDATPSPGVLHRTRICDDCVVPAKESTNG